MIEPTNWLTTRIVMWIAAHTPKCHDMTRLISQERDGPLPFGTRVRMWLHYRICVWCERYRDQLALLAKALHESHEHGHTLPDEAKERLKQALRDKR
jgi:hypothetical protein